MTRSHPLSFPRYRSFPAIAVIVGFFQPIPGAADPALGQDAEHKTYFVRHTVGKDHYDGLTPETAWLTVNRGARELGAGDTLIIGPGLYREGVQLEGSGLPDRPLGIQGDSSGKLTGDPAGPVVMAGAVPMDESIFVPEGTPGVFKAEFSEFKVIGVVEMDGNQRRYRSVRDPISDTPYVERVKSEKRSFWYEEETSTLYIHTSGEKPPSTHEMELIRSQAGFYLVNKPHVWISGLTFRHYGDSGVYFRDGSDHGRFFGNTAFGSRQGVRVQNAHQVQILDNVMFRNENSGAYFLRGSLGGLVQGNLSYENAVGLRFSSESNAGIVIDNTLIGNRDAGLSFEKVGYQVAARNRMQGNSSQLRLIKAAYRSDYNCFETASERGELLATWDLIVKYQGLGEFAARHAQELNSREGDCSIPDHALDVVELHKESLAYRERALGILGVQ